MSDLVAGLVAILVMASPGEVTDQAWGHPRSRVSVRVSTSTCAGDGDWYGVGNSAHSDHHVVVYGVEVV